MNKKIFLIILGFNFYKQDEYYEKFNLTKSCLNYTGEDISYDEYLEEFKRNYKLLTESYEKMVKSLYDLNECFKNEPTDKTYTVEEIRSIIRELELNTDGFNGECKFDE